MLTAERLRQLLSYDPETGVFRRLVRASTAKVGDVAGGPSPKYIKIGVDGKLYYAHQLAFLWMVDRWPIGETDHRDGNKLNNAWANLREATQSQNNGNRGKYRCNKSGFKGVFQLKSKRWFAQIRIDRKSVYLGSFEAKEDASAAYKKAALEQFGEFARF